MNSNELVFEMNLRKDYRLDLKDRIQLLKSKNKAFSHTYFSKKAKVTKGFLTQLFKLKSHCSLEVLVSMIKSMKFTELQSHFITLKYLAAVSGEEDLPGPFQAALKNFAIVSNSEYLQNLESKKISVEASANALLMTFIHGLSRFPQFDPNPEWLQSHLTMGEFYSREQIKAALDECYRRGILKATDSSGKSPDLYATTSPLDPNSRMRGVAAEIEVLQLINQKPETAQPKRGTWAYVTIAEKDVARVREAYNRFLDEAEKIEAESESPNLVYYILHNEFVAGKR